MEYKKLSECAFFSTLRTKEITLENYITTENMLPDKKGVTVASTLPTISSASKYELNDILLSNIRPYFKKIWLADKDGSCSNDVLVIKCTEEYLPRFIYYCLSDDNFFNYSTVTSKGTKMPRGTPNAIMKYSIPDISFDVQNKIADILSNYDNLIENNNKRIKILEQMAENLYKEWFVRFRFPGYEDAEFENGLPKGWKRASFEKIAKFQNGYAFKSDELLNSVESQTFEVFKQGHIERGGGFKPGGTKSWYPISKCSNLQKYVLQKGDILMAMTDMKDNVAILGNTALMPYDNRYILNQRVGLIKPTQYRKIGFEYIYLLTNSYDFVQDLRGRANRGVQVNLSAVQIRESEVVIPNEEINIKFAKLTNPLFEEIFNILVQNENLIKQRDMLLPRLMSGKLEV